MKVLMLIMSLLLAASLAVAGEIYGTITDSDKPVPAGTKVEVAVAGNSYTGETDNFGTYHVFAKDKGKGTLKVFYKDQTPTADIFSYDKSTRYDWTVDNAGGKLGLKRK
jgi:hypothetical protein